MKPRTKNTRVLVVLLAVFLGNITVNAVIIHAEYTDRDGVFHSNEALEAAALDLGSLFPSVGQGIGFLDGVRYRAGTVWAINDRYAISVDHAGKVNGVPMDEIYVTFGENAIDDANAFRMIRVLDRHYPEIELPPGEDTDDIVVYEFEPGSLSGFPMLPPYFGELAKGTEVIHIGRGDAGHLRGQISWDSRRRGVVAVIDSFGAVDVGKDHLITWFHPPIHGDSRPDGGRAAVGDSGGITVRRLDDGTFEAVAINVRVFGKNASDGRTAALLLSDPSVRAFIEPFFDPESIEPTLVPLADNEDEDGDGHTNFEEIVFGSDPRNSNSQPERYLRVTSTDGAILHFFGAEGGNWVDGNYVAGDVCYVVECSFDLQDWGVAEVFDALSGVDAPDGYVTLAYVCREVSAAGYFRIRVERMVD